MDIAGLPVVGVIAVATWLCVVAIGLVVMLVVVVIEARDLWTASRQRKRWKP